MVKIADYIEAPHSGGDYTKVLIVEHLTISPEVHGAARGVIDYWRRARTGSTQYVVDNREILQAVPETAYAWAAGTTANRWGIHIEHCGYLQTVRQWRDGYSTAELDLSSALTAELAAKHGIPARRIGPAQIREAVRTGNPADGGICGHDDITAAFPGETTHTDPGRYFPWRRFMTLVQQHANTTEEFDMDEKTLRRIIREEVRDELDSIRLVDRDQPNVRRSVTGLLLETDRRVGNIERDLRKD